MTALLRFLVCSLALILPTQSWAVAPTLADFQTSTYEIRGSGAFTTPSIAWSTGNYVACFGMTEDQGVSLTTPTVTGLTFSLTEEAGGASDTHVYLWTATAAGTSSGAVSTTVNAGGVGISCFVFSGSDGAGVDAEIANSTAKTITLDTSGTNSHVIVAMADWANIALGTVAATPTGTVRVATDVSGRATFFLASFGDQASAGSTAYGITNSQVGTVNMSGIVFEVLGTAGGAPSVTPFYKRRGQ